jgi:hypothetical protein
MLDALRPVSIWIHGGESVQRDGRRYRVPKRELAGSLQRVLSERRLQVHPSLDHATTLKEEMQNFKAKINPSTGHESYAADWREGDHDDLVLSVAMAVWFGERLASVQARAASSRAGRRESEIIRAQRRDLVRTRNR